MNEHTKILGEQSKRMEATQQNVISLRSQTQVITDNLTRQLDESHQVQLEIKNKITSLKPEDVMEAKGLQNLFTKMSNDVQGSLRKTLTTLTNSVGNILQVDEETGAENLLNPSKSRKRSRSRDSRRPSAPSLNDFPYLGRAKAGALVGTPIPIDPTVKILINGVEEVKTRNGPQLPEKKILVVDKHGEYQQAFQKYIPKKAMSSGAKEREDSRDRRDREKTEKEVCLHGILSWPSGLSEDDNAKYREKAKKIFKDYNQPLQMIQINTIVSPEKESSREPDITGLQLSYKGKAF